MTNSIDIQDPYWFADDEGLDEPEMFKLDECHCCEVCGHGRYCDLDEMSFPCDKYEEEEASS